MADDQFEVVRTATIAAPASTVRGLLNDFHEWMKWSPWEERDPSQERTHSGPDSGVGAVYEWRGNRKVGQGRMEIVEDTSERVGIRLDFVKPFRSSNHTTFDLSERDGQTEVTWRMVGPKTLVSRVMGIFKSMDAMVGPDFEAGLRSLREAAET